MVRTLVALLAFVAMLVVFGCQTYTTGVRQGIERADETAAITALRNIGLAQRSYSVSHEGEFGTLAQLSAAGYLDSRYSSDKPLKDYVLTLTVSPKAAGTQEGAFSCRADPIAGRAGRYFYVDSTSGNIHVNGSQPANAGDPTTQ